MVNGETPGAIVKQSSGAAGRRTKYRASTDQKEAEKHNQPTIPVSVITGGGLTVSVANTNLTLYVVSGDKLDNLVSTGLSGAINLAAGTTCVGIFGTALTALLTTNFTGAMAIQHAVFLVGSIFSGSLSLLFLGMFWRAALRVSTKYGEVKESKASIVTPSSQ